MIHETLRPEIVSQIASLWVFAIPLAGMAFSVKQRLALRNRDGGRCNFPSPHNCNANGHKKGRRDNLQVHHILPQRYCERYGIDPDFAENALTICEEAHQHLIHPDIKDAEEEYNGDRSSFKKVFDIRDELLKRGQPYWNTVYDRAMHAVSVRNTQKAQKNGWFLPPKNGDKS